MLSRLAALFLLITLPGWDGCAQSILFSQDFNGSSNVPDYENASPGIGQFTLVGAGGAGTTVSIEGGQLKMDRISGNSGRFIRRVDFPGPPQSLYIQFKISGTTSGSTTNAATFYVGQFGDNSPVAPSGEVHSRLAFNIGGGGWQVREVGGSTDGQVITTPTQITWVINKAGRTLNYVSPDGGTSTVGDGKADVWVEGRLAFNEIGAVTASQNLTQLKFYFINGTGAFFLDDLLIRDVSGSLPVELTAFRAEPADDGTVALRWATAREVASRYFAVERSADLRSFTEIARREAAGTTGEARQYEATDSRPLRGTSYYRLRQVDVDGREQVFRPVSVLVKQSDNPAPAYPNPSDGRELWLEVPGGSAAQVTLFDFSGKRVAATVTAAAGALLRLRPIPSLPPGLYFVQLQTPEGQWLTRWVVE